MHDELTSVRESQTMHQSRSIFICKGKMKKKKKKKKKRALVGFCLDEMCVKKTQKNDHERKSNLKLRADIRFQIW